MTTGPTPGSSPSLVREAHYHAIRATETWRTFVGAMALEATNSADERARVDELRHDDTTYARGTLGGV